MATLTEIIEYAEDILRLDTETLVKGYDGTDIGPSNEQAQALANRTKWLKDRVDTLIDTVTQLGDRDYVATVNTQTGDVTLTYTDVGAAAKEHTHSPSDIKTTDAAQFVSTDEKTTWDNKQDKLVSKETLKTVLGNSLLGAGNITIKSVEITTDDTAQFVSKDEKTLWNSKQDKLVSGESIATVNDKNLLTNSQITLTYSDVGADKSGAADDAVKNHVAEKDPHTQYLTTTRGDALYLSKDVGNKPNGFLQLDDNGQIPPSLGELFQTRYVVAENLEQRLAITSNGDITICLQTDVNLVYYLNAFKDPSDEDNWQKGRSTDISDVISVFGRSGIIDASDGDYNADQITETTSRVFVSPSEKTTWNNKQDALVSGTNIKTINKESLLGSTDIAITVDSLGAAAKQHTHDVGDINTNSNARFVTDAEKSTWNNKQDALVSATNIKTINTHDITGKGNLDLTYTDVGAAAKEHTHVPSDIKTTDAAQFVSSSQITSWDDKQDKLVSGTDIKTLNKASLLGEGDIAITLDTLGAAAKEHTHVPSDIKTTDDAQFVSKAQKDSWNNKQNILVSGKNLSTVFGQSLLTGYDISIGDADNFVAEVNSILQAGTGITLTFDEDSQKVIISKADDTANKINVNTIENAVANQEYTYTGEEDNYDFLAYALKFIVLNESSKISIDYDGVGSELKTAPVVTFNRLDYATNNASEQLYFLTPVTTDYEKTASTEISAPSADKLKMTIDLGGLDGEIIPAMADYKNSEAEVQATNNNNVIGGTGSEETGYELWKSFQKSESLDVVPKGDHWRWGRIMDKRTYNPSIYITLSEAAYIDSYGFQGFTRFEVDSASPVEWKITGVDEEGKGIEIASDSTETLVNTGKAWNTFRLKIPGVYKQVRLTITKADNDYIPLALSRFQLFGGNGALIKTADAKYYTIESDNTLTEVTPGETMFESNFGVTKTALNVSDLSALFPFTLVSDERGQGRVTFYSFPERIVLHYPLEQSEIWSSLEKISATEMYDGSDNDTIRAAATTDGKTFFVYKDDAWTTLGTLTDDEASAKVLAERGMTLDELSALTNKQWRTLSDNFTGETQIGLAYASVVVTSSDKTTPKAIEADFLSDGYWHKVFSSNVDIYIKQDKIIFKPIQAGTYKFCYKFN